MKAKAYILTMTSWNGSVPLIQTSSIYTTRGLAETVRDVLKVKNEQYPVTFNIEESDIYEFESDVPVLNNANNEEF